MPLEFKNLPLAEVATRFTLAEELPVNSTLVAQLYNHFQGDFPEFESPTAVEVPPGIGPAPFRPPLGKPNPGGFVFFGGPSGLRIGIQDRLISIRWARFAAGSQSPYPRYESMRSWLEKVFDRSIALASKPLMSVKVVNMSYVNFIETQDENSYPSQFFSPQSRLSIMDEATAVQKFEAAWRIKDGCDVRFDVSQAEIKINETTSVNGFALTTAGGKMLANGESHFSELDKVHNNLQKLFDSLISDHAKAEWGYSQ